MKAVRQARLELSGGSTLDQLKPSAAHFPVPDCRCCGQPTNPEVLIVATCACSIVAACRSICVPTTIYCPSKEKWLVSVTVVITT